MKPYYRDETHDVTLYHGRFEDVMAGLPEASAEAVITDPPYPKEYLPLWGPLAEHSARVLVRGGSLLSIVPHYALPSILVTVGGHLKYRWLICMSQIANAHPRMAMGVEVGWKPVGWWVKGAWPKGRGFRKDWFRSEGGNFSELPGKGHEIKLHKWQQSMAWAEACLRFVPAGGLVIDPMAGSGTLLVAALNAGYPVIGIEADEASCETIASRLDVEPGLARVVERS